MRISYSRGKPIIKYIEVGLSKVFKLRQIKYVYVVQKREQKEK
jgi:hypothetical protein